MSSEVRSVLESVIGLNTAERSAALDRLCAGKAEVRTEVEALLGAVERGVTKAGVARAAAVDATVIRSDETAGDRIGAYKLLQMIGEGGFGSVFMAEQEHPVRRRVALKIIKQGMDTKQVVARFEQERQALAIMDHPSIARVFDAGATSNGRPYFVMEYVKGKPITEYCDTERLNVRERLAVFVEVCRAVQHAHTKGVIHRDLKPRNILVSTQDGRALAKVIDFGIAKATAQRMTEKTLFTEHHGLIGTPEYMSPEQAEGSIDIDTRTDVYSLGVLLYELLTGSTPFESDKLRSAAFNEMIRIIREVDPLTPSARVTKLTRGGDAKSGETESLDVIAARRKSDAKSFSSAIRGELDWIVMKALEKDRARRYETPTALAADVERFLAGEPIMAAPASTSYRVRKFVKKHRVPVAAACVVAVVLLGGIAGTTWGLVRAEGQRKLAVEERKATEREKVRAEEARGAEAKAREAAELSGAQNRVARTFLMWGLGFANPERSGGTDLTVKQMLKVAEDGIPGRFRDDPRAEAQARATLGTIYTDIGQYDRAMSQLKLAAELPEQKGGLDDETLVQVYMNLEFGERMSGSPKAREWAIKEVDAIERVVRRSAPAVADALASLNAAYRAGKVGDQVRDQYRQVLVASRAESPEVRKAIASPTLRAMLAGADFWRPDALKPESSNVLLECVEWAEKDDAPPDILGILRWSAASVLALTERYAEAMPICDRMRPDMARWFPEGSLQQAEVDGVTGDVLRGLKRYDEAAPLLVGSHEKLVKLGEPASLRLSPSIHRLIRFGTESGRWDEVSPLLTALLDPARVNPRDARSIVMANDAAWFLIVPEKVPEELRQSAVKAARSVAEAAPTNGGMVNTLAVGLYRIGLFDEAVAMLTRSDELYVKSARPGQDARQVPNWAFIAASYSQLGKPEAAREALKTARELMAIPANQTDENRLFMREVEGVVEGKK